MYVAGYAHTTSEPLVQLAHSVLSQPFFLECYQQGWVPTLSAGQILNKLVREMLRYAGFMTDKHSAKRSYASRASVHVGTQLTGVRA